ncbi:CvpA family protein [Arcobacter sp. 15-2]|uniref:CvpA family protein n=1 Tax=Arcobacter sp. 15-2 TaxID=3374109 RepID=UPI00399C9BC7
MENVNIFDLVVIALVTILGLKGLFRGFTKEFFALVGIVGGVFVASRVSADAGAIVNGIIPMDNENTTLLAGFVAALVVFWIIAYLVGVTLSKVFKMSGLGIFDRILGFVFGAGKIFLLFSIIAYAASQVTIINDNLAPKLEKSTVFPLLKETGAYIIKLDTNELQEEVTKQLDDVVEATKETVTEISQKELEKKAVELKEQLEGEKNEQ